VGNARLTIWNEDECQRVHEATLKVLEEVGTDVRHEGARELLARAGARVEGRRVFIPRALVEAALQSAPRVCQVSGRAAGRRLDLTLDSEHTYYGTGSDCLFVRDPETGERRRVRRADVEGMAALADKLPNIDFVMSMGLPADVPMAVDDLSAVVAMLRGTQKPLLIATRDARPFAAILEMCALAGERRSFAIYAMPTPPLLHDFEGMDKLMRCAELEIPLIYAPAPSAGATAPASITAVIVVGNAEVLAGLVVHQLVREGAPFVYGCGVGRMNMRTAVDIYNAPEVFSGHQAQADLARWYGLPSFAYAGHSDAKIFDGQWAAEAALSTMLGALSRATLLHDVGYLESGLQSSYETIVAGNEMIAWARAYLTPLATDTEALALEEIAAVGPGGNFLGRAHTRQHFRDFWQADLFNEEVWDRWAAGGATTFEERCRARAAELRAQPRSFTLTDDVVATMEALVADIAGSR